MEASDGNREVVGRKSVDGDRSSEPVRPGTVGPREVSSSGGRPVADGPSDESDVLVEAPDDDLLTIIEALLFAAGEVVTLDRLVQGLPRVGRSRVRATVQLLARRYRDQGRAFDVVEIAGGWRLMTRPEFYPFLARMFRGREMERMSPAALETLAIVAYRQPVTRGEIEGIRGVQSDAVVRALVDRKLVRVVGRAEVIGRPRLYGTTRRFLDLFGLSEIEDLPEVEAAGGEACRVDETGVVSLEAPGIGPAAPGPNEAEASDDRLEGDEQAR